MSGGRVGNLVKGTVSARMRDPCRGRVHDRHGSDGTDGTYLRWGAVAHTLIAWLASRSSRWPPGEPDPRPRVEHRVRLKSLCEAKLITMGPITEFDAWDMKARLARRCRRLGRGVRDAVRARPGRQTFQRDSKKVY